MRKLFGIWILIVLVGVAIKPVRANDLRQQCYDHVHDWLLTESIRCDAMGQSAAAQCLQNAVNQANLDNALCDTLDN